MNSSLTYTYVLALLISTFLTDKKKYDSRDNETARKRKIDVPKRQETNGKSSNSVLSKKKKKEKRQRDRKKSEAKKQDKTVDRFEVSSAMTKNDSRTNG